MLKTAVPLEEERAIGAMFQVRRTAKLCSRMILFVLIITGAEVRLAGNGRCTSTSTNT